MKTKNIILIILVLCFSVPVTSQTSGEQSKDKKDKITLKKTKVVQDTILSTYPVLVSVDENVVLPKSDSQKLIANNQVSLHPVPEKGVIYLKIDPLPKEYEPTLEFCNSSGSVMRTIPVRSNISTINLERVPSGKYTVTIDFDEQRYSWKITKE